MTQTSYVNPNGLPADEQITSARDLAILARALIREFPEYDSYWHIPSIRLGKRIYRNTNKLIDAYPGADGMKTGFICASGFNLVATATHDNRRLIAVVLGAPSSAARAVKAAQLFERGFASNPLGWLMPSLGTVDSLVPIAAAPPNLRDDICGNHRKRSPSEEDEGGEAGAAGASAVDDPGGQRSFFLSSLRAPAPHGAAALTSGLTAAIPPVDVYIGPTRNSTPPSSAFEAPPPKKKSATITTAAKPPAAKPAAEKPAAEKPATQAAKPTEKPVEKPADKSPVDKKPADKKTADKPVAKPAPAPTGLKPWPGEAPANADATKDTKSKPAVAAAAKLKPKTDAPAPKTEAQ
jgi:D-alanyl-D-alanine carboxypeptidase